MIKILSEVWQDVDSFEDYQVSNLGNVRSKVRAGIDGRKLQGVMLKPSVNNPGYRYVVLRKNGKSYNRMIHRLVAETFLNKSNQCVNHVDGDKSNNSVINLEWVSFSENRIHSNELGLSPQKGSPIRTSILTPDGENVYCESLMDVNRFFNFKKSWIHNRIRKHGDKFNYNGYEVEVIR